MYQFPFLVRFLQELKKRINGSGLLMKVFFQPVIGEPLFDWFREIDMEKGNECDQSLLFTLST